ncbi:TetR/AcrR family transcriptional regulator [Caballeronia cordobensis]|uniref:TetR/AcrR family transcriptional regulator n=1 Tax=Caballeronia cordobensis TaxID=1353886 RepID=UPI000AE1D08B|nr:TetR/AcrR family transcriptional regulator [Caballeronia cordobensis]
MNVILFSMVRDVKQFSKTSAESLRSARERASPLDKMTNLTWISGAEVPQVKKAEVREAILAAAFSAFSSKGYSATTMTEIARQAGTTVANIYVYFDSKLVILYEIYQPWLNRQLDALRTEVLLLSNPRKKIRRIIHGLWADIPAADHSFANALIDALASAPVGMRKPGNLLASVETFLTRLLVDSLPPERVSVVHGELLAHLIWMAFDGFVINHRIGDERDMEKISAMMVDLLLGPAAEAN